MKELINTMNRWREEKKKIVLARVIQTWGSSPRPTGSSMVIADTLEMAGSVSGGCVEGHVLKAAQQIMRTAESKQLHYGVSDEEAWAVGLTCGGKIRVFLQPWFFGQGLKGDELAELLHQRLVQNQSCILVTQLSDGTSHNSMVMPEGECIGAPLPPALVSSALEAYRKRNHQTITFDEKEFFIHVFPKRSRLIIVGAAHITADLVMLAKRYDFETLVIDPRGVFAKNTVFTEAPDHIFENYPSEVLPGLAPDPYTYAVILSHDPKIDDDALQHLLRSPVAYIGALGSRKNHEKRTARLLNNGFSPEEIKRINAPIGLDMNAQGAKEIALSILGAVIKAKNEFV